MDFAIIKNINLILKGLDDNDYISNLKNVIFNISKILYICKLQGLEALEKGFDSFMDKSVLNHADMGIFEIYSIFDLKSKEIAEKIYKIVCNHKESLDLDSFMPAKLYEILLTPKDKKTLGQVYTPVEIIDGMLNQVFKLKKISKDTKILDPACGGGYFLVESYKKIKNDQNFSELSDEYILENMLYGIDVDNFSIFLTKMGLLFLTGCTNVNFKIFNIDFLTESYDLNGYIDIIIGNPPYLGHKQISKEYKSKLYSDYKDVFYDKSDISYCFFKKGKDLLKDNGVISYVTSRYFMEAMYADRLRQFLKESFYIVSIIDYGGNRVFKDAMVSPAVITLSNIVKNKNELSYVKYNRNESKISKFKFNQEKLNNKGWVILEPKEEELFNRIESISDTYLKDICTIKQGIITGLDKAFIVTEEQIEKYKLEKTLLKKWVKNSNIEKSNITYNNQYLLYTNLIKDEKEFPNTINYLLPYKDRLMERRECKTGLRKWYELQWGRNQTDFERPKIMFPYKARGNNFYYDTNEYFCSADIYIINDLKDNITFEYLQLYLNSGIFEFYFKCQAKKVGENLFEYYPNKLNNVKIYLPKEEKTFLNLSKNNIEMFQKKVFNINEEEEKTILFKYLSQEGDDAN